MTGTGIGIGQVELGRPGKVGVDASNRLHSLVNPEAVFRRAGDPHIDDADEHAQGVAGVMIAGLSGSLTGVSPGAKLYASAHVGSGILGEWAIRSTQHVATRNNGDVYAINHSWGRNLDEETETLNGHSQLTAGFDWIAAEYDVLNVIAGNEFGILTLPVDSFNGIVVGYAERKDGYYRKVAEGNTITTFEGRGFVDIIAPGERIELTNPGSTSTTVPHPEGTSIAAPHVTGAVALLQQFVTDPIDNIGGVHWGNTHDGGPTTRRHEVMKAVLLNSADKISGVHGSLRTIESQTGYTWISTPPSPAAVSHSIPLDPQFGAGHLNVEKAVIQIENGEWDHDSTAIPNIGWDFGETGGFGATLRYPFEETIGGGYIAITLTWDREVENFSEVFIGQPLNNLDLPHA